VAEWVNRGGTVIKPVDTNIVWLDIEAAGIDTKRLVEMGRKHGVSLDTPRIVFHHQIDSQAVRDLVRLFDELLGTNNGINGVAELEVLESGGLALST
jgi:threonine aldolase